MLEIPLIIRDKRLLAVHNLIHRSAPTDAPVMLTGETGTGKEVFAELVHLHSRRRDKPFLKVNCAAFPRELIESELFGSVKGAFTGALADRTGLFQDADGGTLYLDELSEMPVDLQSKLLRVLQDQMVRRVGTSKDTKVNVRIIASLNKPADSLIAQGRLRDDLYYRIGVITMDIPPLRDRLEEIIPMAEAFMEHYCKVTKRPCKLTLSKDAKAALLAHNWPGNVRQLLNEMQRISILCLSDLVELSDLSFTQGALREPVVLKPPLVNKRRAEVGDDKREVKLDGDEKVQILTVLTRLRGNVLGTGRFFNKSKPWIKRRLQLYGINANDYRPANPKEKLQEIQREIGVQSPEAPVPLPQSPPDASPRNSEQPAPALSVMSAQQ